MQHNVTRLAPPQRFDISHIDHIPELNLLMVSYATEYLIHVSIRNNMPKNKKYKILRAVFVISDQYPFLVKMLIIVIGVVMVAEHHWKFHDNICVFFHPKPMVEWRYFFLTDRCIGFDFPRRHLTKKGSVPCNTLVGF